MLDSLVKVMLKRGAGIEETLVQAANLSRQAYAKLTEIQRSIDLAFGSTSFRTETIDPLLDKETQIEAIRARVKRGGHVRTSDRGSLNSLLGRRIEEYETLQRAFPWESLSPSMTKLVRSYIEERKNHHLLGDAERVKSAYRDAAERIPVAC